MLYLSVTESIKDIKVLMLPTTFEHWQSKEWFRNEDVSQIITEIDGNTHKGDGVCYSPSLDKIIGINELSGGTKTLITALNNEGLWLPLYYLGQNCAYTLKWLSEKYNLYLIINGSDFIFADGQLACITDLNRQIPISDIMSLLKEYNLAGRWAQSISVSKGLEV